MKINFHQLVSAVGSKKDKIAAGLLVLYAQAASAGDVQAFDKLYTQLTGWAQGSLGKSIAIIFLLVGLAVGLAKGESLCCSCIHRLRLDLDDRTLRH